MRRFLLMIAMVLPLSLTLHAQNQLVPADDAVQLRRVWTQKGADLSADEYGYNVWGGTDITGDSIADFAVYRLSDGTWFLYRGGNPPETESFWSIDSVDAIPLYIADFWGDGRRHMLVVDWRTVRIDGITHWFMRRRLFELAEGTIAAEPTVSFDLEDAVQPLAIAIGGIRVEDLNHDGADEMVVFVISVRRGYNGPVDNGKQIWIYEGGPDFTLDTPTVIIKDTGLAGAPDNWQVHFADFDGDTRTDLSFSGVYPGVGEMVRFYWGDESSPQSWTERDPDRSIPIVEGTIGLDYNLKRIPYLEDLDGDGAADLTGSEFIPEYNGTYVYLSSRKNARTRSFRIDDADLFYPDIHTGFTVGPLNDSAGGARYDMLPLGMYYVSGSSSGPDFDYESYFPPEDNRYNDAIGRGGPVGDVTGDGWPDYGAGNETYGPFVNTGIASIYAGGPYIPFDDPSTVVEEYPVAGESSGLYLWPNPVDDELHIAWRGNLKSMPSRFEIYDMNGEMVVEGEVEPYRGAAVWRCADVAAGSYLLVAYDDDDNRIADARIIKR